VTKVPIITDTCSGKNRHILHQPDRLLDDSHVPSSYLILRFLNGTNGIALLTYRRIT